MNEEREGERGAIETLVNIRRNKDPKTIKCYYIKPHFKIYNHLDL